MIGLWISKKIVLSMLLCMETMLVTSDSIQAGNKESPIVISEENAQEQELSEPSAVVVKEFIEAVGNDWDYLTTLVINTEDFERYAREYQTNHTGIMNVKNAELVDLVEVQYEDILSSLSYYDYETTDKFYIVGFDAEVYEDTKYYCNGIQYFIIPVKLVDDQWKIATMRQIFQPELLLDKGYPFDMEYFPVAIQMMNLRMQGYFINGKYELYEDIHGNRYDNIDFFEYVTENKIDVKMVNIDIE